MKYLRTFLLSFQENLQYRTNLIFWLLTGIIPSVILTLAWFAILGDKQDIHGFTKSDFVIYYFFQTMGWYIVGGAFSKSLGTRIKNGEVNKTLLKPYHLVLEMFAKEQAWKVTSILVSLPITLFVLFLLRDIISLHLSFSEIVLLIISLLLGAINFALLEAMVGCSAFWIYNVWPIADIVEMSLSLFGGALVPLALMPAWLQIASSVLPFQYVFYTSISILLHKTPHPLQDVFIQAGVAIMLFLGFQLLWRAGIKKYEAIGG